MLKNKLVMLGLIMVASLAQASVEDGRASELFDFSVTADSEEVVVENAVKEEAVVQGTEVSAFDPTIVAGVVGIAAIVAGFVKVFHTNPVVPAAAPHTPAHGAAVQNIRVSPRGNKGVSPLRLTYPNFRQTEK